MVSGSIPESETVLMKDLFNPTGLIERIRQATVSKQRRSDKVPEVAS